MKRVGDVMKELGFREDASEETARAFIENLVRAATGERWTSSKDQAIFQPTKAPRKEEQLSFEFDEPSDDLLAKLTKKSS